MTKPNKKLISALICALLVCQATAAPAGKFVYRVPLKGSALGTPAEYEAASGAISTLAAAQSQVIAGASSVGFSATVADAKGRRAPDGEIVTWSAAGGNFLVGETGTSLGTATAQFNPPTAAGPVSVTARLGNGAQRSATVTVLPDMASARVAAYQAGPTVMPAGDATPLELAVVVHDSYGNEVGAGLTVNWETNAGALQEATSTTDSASVARARLSAPTTTGTANVVARTANGDSGRIRAVTFEANAATARIAAVSTAAPSIVANGTATTLLTATVKDANGNAVGAGVTVSWSTTQGSLAAASSLTDASGTATTTLKSATNGEGTAVVTAKGVAADAGKTVQVQFVSDARFAFTESLVDFGAARFAGSSVRTISLKNTGTTADTPVLAMPTGFTSTACGSVAGGATCQLTVSFSPTVAGQYNGTMKATGKNNAPTIALTGLGQPTYFVGTLNPNQAIYSPDGQKALLMVDNCILTVWNNNTVIWQSDTVSRGSGCYLAAQADGDLVIRRPDGQAVWHTWTSRPTGSTFVYMWDNGYAGFYQGVPNQPGVVHIWDSSQNTGYVNP